MAVKSQITEVTECRKCCGFCDKLVDPAGCVAVGCPYLYEYKDELSDRRFMGCMQKVFEAEIDVDIFELASCTRAGYGGIKATRQPLSHCQFSVERAYQGEGDAFRCVNRRFYDYPDTGPDGYRTRDLRSSLEV